jgi:hypothetical protein
VLYKNGLLNGTKKEFPITVYDIATKSDRVYSENEFIETVFDETKNGTSKDNAFDKSLESVLWKYCIGDKEDTGTLTFCDERTIQFIQSYQFYENSPQSAYNCRAWFDAVLLLKNIFTQRLF